MSNRVIFVVSDSVGETAELVVKAALSQFDGGSSDHSNIRRIPYVEDVGTIKEVISLAKADNGIVCFTLVVPEMRQFLIEEAQYLAHKRLKVANVPIVPEVDPPEELFSVDPKKCIGLKISPDKLNHIRKERLKSLGLNDRAIYANIERIKEELEYFEKVVDRINCQVVDVSNKAVEETANVIHQMLTKRGSE